MSREISDRIWSEAMRTVKSAPKEGKVARSVIKDAVKKVNDAISKGDLIMNKPIDPKQACGLKKMTFDSITATLKLIVSSAAQSGADKYGIWNWLDLENGTMSVTTYLNAVERHLTLYRAGQDYTSDTGIHNLDSIICGLSVVRDAMLFGKVKDDRVKMSEEQIQILEKIINKEIPLTVEVKK